MPALMPVTLKAQKVPGFRFDGSGKSFQSASVAEHGLKVPGMNWSGYGSPEYKPQGFNVTAAQRFREEQGIKNNGGSWFNIGSPGQKVVAQNPDGRLLHVRDGHGHTRHLTNASEHGVKNGKDWFGSGENCSEQRKYGSKSDSRKAASAMIAKIPLPLSRHIAATYKPK